MLDFRCFCEAGSFDGDTIALSPEESLHLVAANRARPGDPVRLFDGTGNEWDATLVEARKNRATLKVEASHRFERPARSIALAQALPKGKLIESIIRKATEIGAQRLHPIVSQRVEARFDVQRAKSKNAKWQTAAIEGAKQSGNPFLLEIEPLLAFEDFLESAKHYELKLIASLAPEARPLKQLLAAQSGFRNAIWLVGPEGDFTSRETELAIEAGFLPTSLGPHVMRCETAAVAALSLIRHELDG